MQACVVRYRTLPSIFFIRCMFPSFYDRCRTCVCVCVCSQKSSLRPCAGACAPQTCAKSSGCRAYRLRTLATLPPNRALGPQTGRMYSVAPVMTRYTRRSDESSSRDRPLGRVRLRACAKAGRTLPVCLCVPVPTSKRNNCREQATTDDCV
uniref:Uncharacterized protein n=1 Tax=Rhipicephalus zambeziensis TaxID=60191 RepID=A0A224Y6D7_9ACAR